MRAGRAGQLLDKPCLDDLLFEDVRARLAVAHELGRRSDLQFSLAIGEPCKGFPDQAPKTRRDESFLNPNSLRH